MRHPAELLVVHHGSLTADQSRPKLGAPELEIHTVRVGFRPENYQGERGKLRDKRWKAQVGAWLRGDEWFVREVRETLLITPRRSVS